MNEALLIKFTKIEVKEALMQMAPIKSQGPDGFNAGSYKFFWHFVGEDVTSIVLKFMNEGAFNRGINHTPM